MTSNVLTKIVAHKRAELAQRQAATPLPSLEEAIASRPPPRAFAQAISRKAQARQPAVIAEVKKASPSKGVLRADFNPKAIAKSYQAAGATCLSVLTDEHFFQGKDDYLSQASQQVAVPILRKDFIIDPYQIYEARAIGADCILLIAGILTPAQLQEYHALATSLGMAALVEVHDEAELTKALPISPQLIGVNNRDLKTFNVDLNATLKLLPLIPPSATLVTESGLHSRAEVEQMLAQGVYAFLVGEAFMRHPDPGTALKQLFP